MSGPRPVLPPGTILTQKYFRERLNLRPPGHFVEIGCGGGNMSRLLLDVGWRGVGYDLNPQALAAARSRNQSYIESGSFAVSHSDWISAEESKCFDLVFSCLVLEHLDDEQEGEYYRKAARVMTDRGYLAFFVPGSPAHWGVEDEVAGHFRRYNRAEVVRRLGGSGLRPTHIAGLTYPISNLILPISNYLVAKYEAQKSRESMRDRTIMSGNRTVPLKTQFPDWFGLFLNEITMYPFHLLQKAFSRHPSALILYVEATRA